MLAAWAEAEKSLATTAATFVVDRSTGLGRGLLPAARARLAERAPHARLTVRQVPWDDPTGGLSTVDTDAAFVWLPLPDPAPYRWTEVATEPRMVALPSGHRLAAHEVIDFADLLDEPFLALPTASGALRDFWLAVDARDGRPPVIGAEITTTEETVEALTSGLGVCLVAAGNVPLVDQAGVAVRPLRGVAPSRLVLAWRRDDERPLLAHLRAAVSATLPAGS